MSKLKTYHNNFFLKKTVSTDLPVNGDWNGDRITDIAVYRPSAHTFYLKNGTALSWTTTAINWGTSTDLPVTGKW